MRLVACVVAALAIAVVALRVLELAARHRPRTRGWYVSVQLIGTPVLAVIALLPALLAGTTAAVFVSGPIILVPFIAWDIAGLRRARPANGGTPRPGR